ncbi:MAG: ASCH domain-containing protein [Enterobacteriaceae bacterium]|jgi:uncharacterized protein YhfF|nr:ASCH domain-containing protein [Enterobacteriaceae bacterium]
MTHHDIEIVQNKYQTAGNWLFGDSPEMQDSLADLVFKGIKTATSCSFASYQQSGSNISIGNKHLVLNSQNKPICTVRIIALHLITFSEMTTELAWKEGEGDRSVKHWQQEHQSFFEREGVFFPEMEVVVIEFEVIDLL